MRPALLAAGLLAFCLPSARAVDKTVIERAVDRGVAALKASQGVDGRWAATDIGATALVGLTLLECGVSKDDKIIKNAVEAVRKEGLTLTHTYSLSLSVLFLDKFDDAADTPLIESMIVRLLAGQQHAGGWSYNCPNLAPAEMARIKEESNPDRKLRSGRDLEKLPEKGKRSKADLPAAVRAQLELVNRGAVAGAVADGVAINGTMGDNSNTQFATLALWTGRRYGIPTQDALVKVAERFRRSQSPDGGWGYIPGTTNFIGGATPAMTCAGILGLACGHGGVLDKKKAKDAKVESIDVSKDDSLKAGLGALATAVGKPIGWNGVGAPHAMVRAAQGRLYYFLWSLERVAVILNLDTIGGKDWYNWGAEIILAGQEASGLWVGQHAVHGNADTCFALLFLKKANLARDLSGALKGLKESNSRILKGGAGRGPIADSGPSDRGKPETGKSPADAPRLTMPGGVRSVEIPKPAADTEEEKAAVKLGDEVLSRHGEDRVESLKKLRDGKGAPYTEVLVWVISRQDGEGLKQCRVALAERFTRLKETTLREYLKDDVAEVRRAAALAAAARGSKILVPDLISRLSDGEDLVRRGAYAALKELTGKDYGPSASATVTERKEAIAAWLKWWKENSRE